jgi:hypothetical protein
MFSARIQFWRMMRFLSVVIIACMIVSCQLQDDEEVGLELPVDRDDFGIHFTDTITVTTSTVLLDSVATTNTGYLITGQYVDDKVGKITAKSYLGIGLGDAAPGIEEKAVYDSLVLFLDYDTYSYGDTTRLQSLYVHQLSEELSDSETYYGFEQASYETTSLGSQTFRARPFTRQPLRIKISDELGKELFELAQNNSLSSEADLRAYLNGVALIPGTDDNGAILRFTAASDSTVLRLYYHENNQGLEEFTYDFKVSNGGTYFNQFSGDRSQTLLAPLQQTFQAVKSNVTQEETFIQGGISLHTRIDIPYIQSLKSLGMFAINKAELIVEPVAGSYSGTVPLPQSLLLQEVNGSNWITSSSSDQFMYIKANHVDNSRFYSYDLTSYVNAILDEERPSKRGLLLSLPATDNRNTLQRLILGSGANTEYQVKVEIYYTLLQPGQN